MSPSAANAHQGTSDHLGCCLDIVPQERIVFKNAFVGGWHRPRLG